MRGCGSRRRPGEGDPSKGVMAAQRPDFRRERSGRTFDGNAGERTRTSKGRVPQRDLNPPRLPVPPRPRFEKDRGEQALPNMREQDERERESRESPETRYEEVVQEESEERSDAAERLPELPAREEENEGD